MTNITFEDPQIIFYYKERFLRQKLARSPLPLHGDFIDDVISQIAGTKCTRTLSSPRSEYYYIFHQRWIFFCERIDPTILHQRTKGEERFKYWNYVDSRIKRVTISSFQNRILVSWIYLIKNVYFGKLMCRKKNMFLTVSYVWSPLNSARVKFFFTSLHANECHFSRSDRVVMTFDIANV